MNKDDPKLDIPLAPEVAAEAEAAAAAVKSAERATIFLVSTFREMDGTSVKTIQAYTPVDSSDSKIGFAGMINLKGPKGESGPTIEFPIEAEGIQEAFRKFDETRKTTLESLRADMRKRVLASGAGLGIDALKKLRG